MRVVQTVFGVFHHFDLARQLQARGHLQMVYSTWPWQRLRREGIPHEKVRTFPWIHTPEYLLHRARVLPRWIEDQTGYANALLFDEYTLRVIPDCDALIAISGSSLKTGKLVQDRGGIFICDRGSTHQRYQEEIVTEEFRLWGSPQAVTDPRDTRREEAIYQQADAITVGSTFARRSFLEMGLPSEKVHITPYGVRLDNFKPAAEPPSDRFEVLFAGSVGLRKGVPYLLQAFAKLRHPNKRLRFAGAVLPDIKHVLSKLPLENVEFLGALPQAELSRHMSSSHVLVLPSIEDGFGMVMGQAMACGCPVIASVNSGGPDLITEGREGFLVPIRDPEAIAQKLQQLADDPALQASMRAASLVRVKSLGGWDAYGECWEQLLYSLTAKR